MRRALVSVLLGLALSAGAQASEKVIEKPVIAGATDTPEKFTQLIDQVHREMGPGGRYEFIHADAKVQVDADLDAMAAMLKKSGSVTAMDKREQVDLFNRQEHVNGILTRNDGNRLVCEHRPPMGSNIPVTSCRTVAEIEKQRRDAQKMVQDADHRGQILMKGQ